jgi:hypothetical protein
MVGAMNGEVAVGADFPGVAESEVTPNIPMAAIAMAPAVSVPASFWARSAESAKPEADLPSLAA